MKLIQSTSVAQNPSHAGQFQKLQAQFLLANAHIDDKKLKEGGPGVGMVPNAAILVGHHQQPGRCHI